MPPRPSSRMISYCPIRVPGMGAKAGPSGPVLWSVGTNSSSGAVPIAGCRGGTPLSLDVRVNPGRMALHPHLQPTRGLRRAISFQDRPGDCDVGIGHDSSFTADGIFLCLGG